MSNKKKIGEYKNGTVGMPKNEKKEKSIKHYTEEDLLDFAYYVYSKNNDMVTKVYIKADIKILFKKWFKNLYE